MRYWSEHFKKISAIKWPLQVLPEYNGYWKVEWSRLGLVSLLHDSSWMLTPGRSKVGASWNLYVIFSFIYVNWLSIQSISIIFCIPCSKIFTFSCELGQYILLYDKNTFKKCYTTSATRHTYVTHHGKRYLMSGKIACKI